MSLPAISPALMTAILHFCIFNGRIFHVRFVEELPNFMVMKLPKILKILYLRLISNNFIIFIIIGLLKQFE